MESLNQSVSHKGHNGTQGGAMGALRVTYGVQWECKDGASGAGGTMGDG